MKKLFFVGAMLLCVTECRSQSFDPVNKHATPEVKKLLQYLYSIKGKYILAGQHNYNHEPNLFSDSAFAITGKYPAVWGNDFIWNGNQDNGQAIVNEAIKKNRE